MFKWLRKKLPSTHSVRHHPSLKIFGKFIHSPNLWHMNSGSVSRASACGLFFCFMPIPFQMVFAAAFAMLLRANVFISVVLVWISNPLTIPPIFYFCYKIGRWILKSPPHPFKIQLSLHWLHTTFLVIWKPLVVGSLICGAISAIIGYTSVRIAYWYIDRRKTLRLSKM